MSQPTKAPAQQIVRQELTSELAIGLQAYHSTHASALTQTHEDTHTHMHAGTYTILDNVSVRQRLSIFTYHNSVSKQFKVCKSPHARSSSFLLISLWGEFQTSLFMENVTAILDHGDFIMCLAVYISILVRKFPRFAFCLQCKQGN